MSVVLGIDPGLTGAIAAICQRRGLLDVADLPTCSNGLVNGAVKRWIDVAALADILKQWGMMYGFPVEHVSMAVERPIAMPAQSIATAASSFDTFGALRAVAALRRLPLTLITPREWKAFYGLGKGKDASLRAARDLFPSAVDWLKRAKDHNRSEAILIARYVLRAAE